jgi:CDP-ribitol ribitolphosphotransferase
MYPLCYYLGCLRQVDEKKVVFVENHQDYMSDNYALLYDRLCQEEYEISVHYLKISSSGWLAVVGRTLRMLWDMATAKCVFVSESNSVFGAFTLRKDTKLVQVWHACGAFKKWGYSVADKSFGDDKRTLDLYSPHKNYNLVAVSGDAVCWAYEEAFGLQNKPGIVKALGVSRTDVFFDQQCRLQACSHLEQLGAFVKERKIILYAPTFRGDIRYAKSPEQLDLQTLYPLREKYVLLVKQHPFVKKKMEVPAEYADFCMEITDQLSMEELLMVADICITDYSSIVFEYSLMQKPILFFAYDLEGYYDERGFYYPYEEFVPGPVVRTTQELLAVIEDITGYDFNRLREFRQRYMNGCDGRSTERILENIFERKF